MNTINAPTSSSELIAAVSGELTPTERRIAEEVLSEPTLLAFGTVSDLATRVDERLEVSRRHVAGLRQHIKTLQSRRG